MIASWDEVRLWFTSLLQELLWLLEFLLLMDLRRLDCDDDKFDSEAKGPDETVSDDLFFF